MSPAHSGCGVRGALVTRSDHTGLTQIVSFTMNMQLALHKDTGYAQLLRNCDSPVCHQRRVPAVCWALADRPREATLHAGLAMSSVNLGLNSKN